MINVADVNLDEHMISTDAYKQFGDVEKRFRHLIRAKNLKTGDDVYYCLCELGLQNKKDGEWKWGEMDVDEDRDFKTARMFQCTKCQGRHGRLVWFVNKDPSRILSDQRVLQWYTFYFRSRTI